MAEFDDARAFWDRRFAAPDYIFGTEPNRFLTAHAHRLPAGAEVLDVACGEGRNSVWLARQGHRVTGFDISPLALDKARRLATDRRVAVAFAEGDVRQHEWQPDRWDAIVCIFIQFAAPDDRARLFDGFFTALRPGGLVLLQGYTPKQLDYRTGGPAELSHLYTAELLQTAFGAFEILHLETHEADLAEGTKHVGRSALIDLVARKPV